MLWPAWLFSCIPFLSTALPPCTHTAHCVEVPPVTCNGCLISSAHSAFYIYRKKEQAPRRSGYSAITEGPRWRAGAEKPSYADVSLLADAAADLPVTSPLTESIMDIVNAAEDWLEAARKTVAKRNSGQKLGKCLQWMLASLDRALEQFTLRLQVPASSLLPLNQDTYHLVE